MARIDRQIRPEGHCLSYEALLSDSKLLPEEQFCPSFLYKPGFHGHFSLRKIIYHRHFGNEFVFTHSKDYLYYLAHSPLSQILDNHRIECTRAYFSATYLLCQRKIVRGNEA